MIRRHCDICGDEMGGKNVVDGDGNGRLTALLSKGGVTLQVEVIQCHNGVANAGDFCKYCILDALYKLDDRDREAPAP